MVIFSCALYPIFRMAPREHDTRPPSEFFFGPEEIDPGFRFTVVFEILCGDRCVGLVVENTAARKAHLKPVKIDFYGRSLLQRMVIDPRPTVHGLLQRIFQWPNGSIESISAAVWCAEKCTLTLSTTLRLSFAEFVALLLVPKNHYHRRSIRFLNNEYLVEERMCFGLFATSGNTLRSPWNARKIWELCNFASDKPLVLIDGDDQSFHCITPKESS